VVCPLSGGVFRLSVPSNPPIISTLFFAHNQKHVRYFLKFSEIVESTLEDVVATMLLNAERTLAAGVPTPITLPPPPAASAAVPAKRAQAPADEQRRKYEVTDPEEGDDQYDEIVHNEHNTSAGSRAPYSLAGRSHVPPARPPSPPNQPNIISDDAYEELPTLARGGSHDRSGSGSSARSRGGGGDAGDHPVLPPRPPIGSSDPALKANTLYGSVKSGGGSTDEDDYDEMEGGGETEDIVYGDPDDEIPPPRGAAARKAETILYGPPDDNAGGAAPPRPAKDMRPPPRPAKNEEPLNYGYELASDDPAFDGGPPPPRPGAGKPGQHGLGEYHTGIPQKRPPPHEDGTQLMYDDIADEAPPPPRPPRR
jgi:hypothetical protein